MQDNILIQAASNPSPTYLIPVVAMLTAALFVKVFRLQYEKGVILVRIMTSVGHIWLVLTLALALVSAWTPSAPHSWECT